MSRDANAFDVVVVGSGSAGSIVAARLAEKTSASVLLLEAGPDLRTNPPTEMHDGWVTYREFGWGYESEPNDQGDTEPLARGRLVGGTSWRTRFMMRGSPADFDAWARQGNEGWAFESLLPYFQRLEHDLDFGDRPWHGNSGRIPVTRYPAELPSEYEAAALAALAAAGLGTIEDHNEPGAVGAARMPMNARAGRRVTGADGYLPAGATPANLHVQAEAPVASLVVEGSRVTGVRLFDGRVVNAGWVVLSAGVYGTPVILMHSGIGPADHLQAVGVSVVHDLPGVGANLADHPGVDLDPGYRADGPITPRFHLLATWRSSQATSADAPDLAIWAFPPMGDPAEAPVAALLLRPESRGSVRLRSSDPSQLPSIRLPGVCDQVDVERLAEAIERAHEVVRSPHLRAVCSAEPTTAPAAPDELRTLARRADSYPHTVGTCAMGPTSDDGAVVDPECHVHGIERLSIVDASILPTAPSGFPHLITMMAAERFAERFSAQL
ncbi:MAG TPA: GMC oxidoreductase [Mycobacteriales bacterium]|nr:GMC oxidoreductase [Mycobacteriales bacterium]